MFRKLAVSALAFLVFLTGQAQALPPTASPVGRMVLGPKAPVLIPNVGVVNTLWACEQRVREGYAPHKPTCRIEGAGAVQADYVPLANGKIDRELVLARGGWARSFGGTYSGGTPPRAVTIYSQGTQAADLTGSTTALSPAFDPYALRQDEPWCPAFYGYGGDSALTSNPYMSWGSAGTHNDANHLIAWWGKGISNVGISGGNTTLITLTQAATNQVKLQLGDDNFTANRGVGVIWASAVNKVWPTTNIPVSAGPEVIIEQQSTGQTIDGITGATGAAVLSLRTARGGSYAVATTNGTTSTNSGRVGSGATAGSATGAAQQFCGGLVMANAQGGFSLLGVGVDKLFLRRLADVVSVDYREDAQVIFWGASTMCNYASFANGLTEQLRRRLKGHPKITVICQAGANNDDTALGAQSYIEGLYDARYSKHIVITYNVRDVSGAETGATIFSTKICPSMTGLFNAGFTTLYFTRVASSAAGIGAEADAQAAAVMNGANMSSCHYTGIDTRNSASLDFATNPTMWDSGGAHMNETLGIPRFVNYVVDAVNAVL